MSIATLQARVRHQRDELPVLYGDIDFGLVPERLALGPDDESDLPGHVKVSRAELLADTELVELMTTATMLGDVVCDAYVCLMPELGMQRLIHMVRTACHEGLDAVEDAPAELVAFIESMASTRFATASRLSGGCRWASYTRIMHRCAPTAWGSAASALLAACTARGSCPR